MRHVDALNKDQIPVDLPVNLNGKEKMVIKCVYFTFV